MGFTAKVKEKHRQEAVNPLKLLDFMAFQRQDTAHQTLGQGYAQKGLTH